MPDSTTSDADLAVRAAWMHYAGGYTQAEVAGLLGLSKVKAHRLITRANREGMVKVYVDGDISECLLLEQTIAEMHGLDYCEVVPDFDLDPLPLKALGTAGGRYMHRLLDGETAEMIGIGHGRTLAACVDHIPRTRATQVQFVSLLGGFTEKFAANPHDVMHRLAERTGAQAYVMPVPFVANTVEDREVLVSQKGLREVIGKARNTTLKIIGIGTVALDSSLVTTGMVDKSEIKAVASAGGVGEMLGHFFSKDGQITATSLSDRIMGLSLNDLKDAQIVAIAGGDSKAMAINAALKSGLLKGLITDERTASALVDSEEIRKKRNQP